MPEWWCADKCCWVVVVMVVVMLAVVPVEVVSTTLSSMLMSLGFLAWRSRWARATGLTDIRELTWHGGKFCRTTALETSLPKEATSKDEEL